MMSSSAYYFVMMINQILAELWTFEFSTEAQYNTINHISEEVLGIQS